MSSKLSKYRIKLHEIMSLKSLAEGLKTFSEDPPDSAARMQDVVAWAGGWSMFLNGLTRDLLSSGPIEETQQQQQQQVLEPTVSEVSEAARKAQESRRKELAAERKKEKAAKTIKEPRVVKARKSSKRPREEEIVITDLRRPPPPKEQQELTSESGVWYAGTDAARRAHESAVAKAKKFALQKPLEAEPDEEEEVPKVMPAAQPAAQSVVPSRVYIDVDEEEEEAVDEEGFKVPAPPSPPVMQRRASRQYGSDWQKKVNLDMSQYSDEDY